MEANNAAAMRKALERQVHFLQRLHAQEGENGVVSKVRLEEEIKAVTAALSAPPRNCDVGTAKKQNDRYVLFCKSHKKNHGNCFGCTAFQFIGRCEFAWAQMPYEEGGNDGSR